jgi:hypothetical protein
VLRGIASEYYSWVMRRVERWKIFHNSDHSPPAGTEDRRRAEEPQNEGENVSHGLVDGGWRGRYLIFCAGFRGTYR